jgi:DNA-binding MarR family transcriptional regulator/N-acetylglutamate synthase-like GNAT family acetyltransferase
MVSDVIRERPYLFLGSRLKRIGESMQADVLKVVEQAGLPVQPAQYPVLAALDRHGPLGVGDLVAATGVSQPGVTRTVAKLIEMGLVEAAAASSDRRRRTVRLSPEGLELMTRSRVAVWPAVEAAVVALCEGLKGSLLDQLDAVEDRLAERPLHRWGTNGSARPAVEILPFDDALADEFHDINAEWIRSMFVLEPTDREVLEKPRARILDPGGDILFAKAGNLGVVGTCALQKTGEHQFELTKMGVRETARGLKVGEALLEAVIARAGALGARTLYLLTNSKCAPAIHLYEKLGFVHDAGIMARFGARYARCDVAMLYQGTPRG